MQNFKDLEKKVLYFKGHHFIMFKGVLMIGLCFCYVILLHAQVVAEQGHDATLQHLWRE